MKTIVEDGPTFAAWCDGLSGWMVYSPVDDTMVSTGLDRHEAEELAYRLSEFVKMACEDAIEEKDRAVARVDDLEDRIGDRIEDGIKRAIDAARWSMERAQRHTRPGSKAYIEIQRGLAELAKGST